MVDRDVANRPPSSAPSRNPASAAKERGTESPGAPAAANPRKTMLPVILAVKTWPRLRKLTASTSPVTTVNRYRSASSLRSRRGSSSIGSHLEFVSYPHTEEIHVFAWRKDPSKKCE